MHAYGLKRAVNPEKIMNFAREVQCKKRCQKKEDGTPKFI